MKYRYSVLILKDSNYQSERPCRRTDRHPILPGSRLKNYVEFVTGLGIPFEIVDVNEFNLSNILDDNLVRCTSVIIACPIGRLSAEQQEWLKDCSFRYGVSLIADSFLFSKRPFLEPFGIKKCRTTSFSMQKICSNDGGVLYKVRPYPFSSKGADFGYRPILRLLMQSWFSRRLSKKQEAHSLASFRNGIPAVVCYQFGEATNYFLNFQPGRIFHNGNRFHQFFKNILTNHSRCPSVSIQYERGVCLRMDDPGASERVHLKGFNDGVISRELWNELIQLLEGENAKLSVAYVAEWVDDGDPRRGTLIYRGTPVWERIPGKHYTSREVTYHVWEPDRHHDYASQYEAMRAGVNKGVISILSHGLTHLSVDIKGWLNSQDQYTNMEWYREFCEMVSDENVERGILIQHLEKSVEEIRQAFGVNTQIVVPSAHMRTEDTPGLAREAGFKILSSKETNLLWDHAMISNRKLGAFYPEEFKEAAALSNAGYPILFVFHDYDVYRKGAFWLKEQVIKLQNEGVKTFLAMEEWGALLMARMDVILNENDLLVKIDFTSSLDVGNFKGMIPLHIEAVVSEIRTADGATIPITSTGDSWTRTQVPYSYVTNGRLSLIAELNQDIDKNREGLHGA
ncbi:hypothetical protein CEE37_14180 [candidate division LCP-89 bacterium B3_LCP]|uniref:Uncharacterized protein n=1 Tax=candidate division LCP-89 bacterium B3_LCP TaxID=2012998 RepID=A0A532UR27_UNCL8|nr:MAG: hypothetical protein CEE37_14180 [candidate division LCP-89 bacterium B3_LCP]